jgi:hypothetical protein
MIRRGLGKRLFVAWKLIDAAKECDKALTFHQMELLSAEARIELGDRAVVLDIAIELREYLDRVIEDINATFSEEGDSQLTRLALREEKAGIGDLRPIGENAPIGRRGDGSQRRAAAEEPRRQARSRRSRTASGGVAS